MQISKINQNQNFGMPWKRETLAKDKDYLLKRMLLEQASLDEASRVCQSIKWLSHPENTPNHTVFLLRTGTPEQQGSVWFHAMSNNPNYNDVSLHIDSPYHSPKRTADIFEKAVDKIKNSCINPIPESEEDKAFIENALKHLDNQQ